MKRRTQADRREATVRKLLDAAAGALVEVGYANASVMEISRRAGVSHGGLFRHFPSVESLMVAAAEDLGQKILSRYLEKFEALAAERDPLPLALALLRESCRSKLNQAWYELAIAARTRPRLKRAVAPLGARYYRAIGGLARQLLPELAASLGEQFELLVETVVATFDGEQLHRFLLRDPAADRARLALLQSLIEGAAGSAKRTRTSRRRVAPKMHTRRS